MIGFVFIGATPYKKLKCVYSDKLINKIVGICDISNYPKMVL